MKKLISLLLVAVLLTLALPVCALADNVKLPKVSFESDYYAAVVGKELWVHAKHVSGGSLPAGAELELRDQYGRVWATKVYRPSTAKTSFGVTCTEAHTGEFEFSVWYGDACVSKNTTRGFVATTNNAAVQRFDVDGVISITLDCAFSDDQTDDILAVLDKYGVKATFFMAGCFVSQFTESAIKIRDAGHEIGSHSLYHAKHTELKDYKVYEQINGGILALQEYLGVTPHLYRVPYGAYNQRINTFIRAMGMEVVQWEIDAHDWDDAYNHAKIVDRATRHAKAGDIILFHLDGRDCPANLDEALNHYINVLGLRVIPVSELFALANHDLFLSPYIPEEEAIISSRELPVKK